MGDRHSLGLLVLASGLILALVGGAMLVGGRPPGLGWVGRLPGDIVVRRGPVTVYLPIATSIVLSVLLTLLLRLVIRR